MKRAIPGAFLLFFHYSVHCCSFFPTSFCETINLYPENLVISGIVVATDNFGIDIQVIEVLRGVEDKPVIRVWDGTDFECNGHFSMSALGIGALYDTVIIMLPQIVGKENDWDVPGDYRRPNPYTQTPELDVEGGIAIGFISGDYWAPIEYTLTSVDYDSLTQDLMVNGDCSSIFSANKEADAESDLYVSNPFTSGIIVQSASPLPEGSIKLFSISGGLYLQKQVSGEQLIELNVQDLPPGIYLIEVSSAKRRTIRKIVKHHDD